jgi:vesicle transport through interaction with t-SNAREs protein 1
MPTSTSKDAKVKLLAAIDNDVQEAEKTLKQMDIYISSVDKSERAKYTQNLKKYKADLDVLKKDYLKNQEELSFQEGKDNLFGGDRDGKEKLIDHGTKMTEQNNKLAEAKRMAYESEDISLNIQRELNRNTETLQRAINKTKQTEQEVGTSNNLLNVMQRRMMMNKATLYIICGVLVLALIIILIVKFS